VNLGVPSGLTQAIFSLAMMVVQRLINGFGDEMFIACNVMVMRVDGYAMLPNFSFGQAMGTFTGQNVGARRLDRIRQGTRQGLLLALGTALVLTPLVLLFGPVLMRLFTPEQALIDLSMRMMYILAAGYIAMAATQVLAGVMRGAGDTLTPMWITLGTTIGVMANSGMVRRDGRIPHQTQIMLGDAVATSVGACFGTSSVTAYVESVAGVAQGGRTGMTALVVALCFAASLFLAPLFLCIPDAATAPVLIISGFYLFSSVRFIDMTKMTEAVPSFITIVVMPATDSIADGILIGVGSYAMLSAIDRLLHPRRYDDNDEIAEHEQNRQQTVG
jgi:xanthine/uracil/vitamin C permease (AzgA family)